MKDTERYFIIFRLIGIILNKLNSKDFAHILKIQKNVHSA